MEDFKKIIEQLRQEKYFLYDVAYTDFDSQSISIDDKMYLETGEKRGGHRTLSKLLDEHLSNGLKLKIIKAEISFGSYTAKVPEQRDNKTDNRCDYTIEVDFGKKLAAPHERMCNPSNVKKMYEDFERIFTGCGWQFGSEK